MADELVDLSKSGALGVNSPHAYASLGYGANLEVNFCNGFNLEFGAEAYAEAGVSQHLAEYFEVLIEVEAGIAAGVQVAAQLSPKLLDELGLIASFQAYLKAYIRARLELTLTLEKILREVEGKSSDLQYRIFEAFIEQIEIGIGVEANAQIALTAAAEIVCQARVIEDQEEGKEPGFDFRANAEAAFLFGAGFDFFAMSRFNDITGFFKTTKNILLEELEEELTEQEIADPETLNYLFKVWSASLDLIICASMGELQDKRKSTFATLSTFTLDAVLDIIIKQYTDFLNSQASQVISWLEDNIDDITAPLDRIIYQIANIKEDVESVNDFFDILDIIDELIDLLDEINFDELDVLQEMVTHIYFLGYLFDEQNEQHWKQIPDYAKTHYTDATGQTIQEIGSRSDAYLYLENSCMTNFLRGDGTSNNDTFALIGLLHDNELTLGSFMEILLDHPDEEARNKLIETGIDILHDLFEKHVIQQLENEVRPVLANTNNGGAYYNVVIDNLVNSFSQVFVPMSKLVFVDGGSKKDIDNLTTLANRFLMNFLAKNVSFFSNELLNHSTENITHSINQCEQYIRGGNFEFMVEDLFDNVEEKIDDIVPYPAPNTFKWDIMDKLIYATGEFLLDILAIARLSMGRQTWTEPRIRKISDGIEYTIFNPDSNHLDFRILAEDQIEEKIDELNECNFLPSVSEEQLFDMIQVMQAISLKQLEAFLFRMPLALAEYFIRLLKILFIDLIIEILDELLELMEGIYEHIKELIQDLIETIERLKDEIIEVLEDIGETIEELFEAVEEAIDEFFDSLIDDLDFDDLDWLDDIIDAIVSLFGGQSEEEKARAVVNELRKRTKQNLDKQTFVNGFEAAVKQENYDDQFFQNWMGTNVLTDDIIEELNKVSFESQQAVSEKWAYANASLAGLKHQLGRNSSDYISRKLALDHSEGRLEGLELKKLRFDKQFQHLDAINEDEIHINSPLMVDAENDQIPVYGEYLYIDINFGRLDIRSIIRDQLDIDCDELVDINDDLSTVSLRREIRRIEELEKTSLVQVKILLNGDDLNLDQFDISRHRLQGHVDSDLLRQGSNDLFLCLITPTAYQSRQIVRHVRFFSDKTSKQYPSNAIYIDAKKSIINTRGDDHEDARRPDTEGKEKVVISNNSDKEADLEGWTLKDAAGHVFEFVNRPRIKPKDNMTVFIGETPGGGSNYSWKEYYNGRMIAVLNNKGEFLKLENSKGKVISHIYTGNPKSNKHINFVDKK